MNNTEVTRRKITRGLILDALYHSQATPMLAQTLELALLPGNPQVSADMTPCLNFLADRGYILVIRPDEPDINPVRGIMVRITDKGQDVIEGTTKDASVILPNGR